MPQGYGYQSFAGFGEESAWGEAASRTHFLEIAEDSLKAVRERTFSESFRQRSKVHYVRGKEGASGSLGFEMSYRGFEMILKHIFGAMNVTTLVEGMVARHDFAFTDEPPTGLSVEVNRGAAAFLYTGCRVNQASFSFDTDKIVRLTTDFIAKNETQVAASAPTFVTEMPIPSSDARVFLDGTEIPVQSFELTIKHGLDADRRRLGAREILPPVPGGKREITGALRMFFESTAEYNRFVNGAEAGLLLLARGNEIPAIPPDPNLRYEFALQCPRIVFTGETPVVDSPGALSVRLPFEALGTGGPDVVLASLVNEGGAV